MLPLAAMETSLYLFPRPVLGDPPDPAAVHELLHLRGFVGAPLEGDRHRAGKTFAAQITYAGCSPHLVLEPPPDDPLACTHVRIFTELPPRLRITPKRGRPRCPGCAAVVKAWEEYLPEWEESAALAWRCPSCGLKTPAAELDWRQYGVAGRLLVEVTRVWPGEALPADALLVALEEATGRLWSYGWAESSRA